MRLQSVTTVGSNPTPTSKFAVLAQSGRAEIGLGSVGSNPTHGFKFSYGRVKMDTVLIIIMRDDMDSMNPGKAMAQTSHATNDFMAHIARLDDQDPYDAAIGQAYQEWRDQAGNFGTCLVFAASIVHIKHIDRDMSVDPTVICGVTRDPTYPFKDGETVTHLIDIPTCSWIFGNRQTILKRVLRSGLELHP